MVPEIVSRLCVFGLLFIFGIKQVLFIDLCGVLSFVNVVLLMKKETLTLEANFVYSNVKQDGN